MCQRYSVLVRLRDTEQSFNCEIAASRIPSTMNLDLTLVPDVGTWDEGKLAISIEYLARHCILVIEHSGLAGSE